MTTATTTNLDHIPSELRDCAQWVRWRYVGPENRKVPFDCNGGQQASSTDPATWSTFQQAIGFGFEHFNGVGFVFTSEDDFAGVDLDRCIDESGQLVPEAQAIIDKLNSYTEVSPSGRGVKVFLRGSLPESAGSGRKRPAKTFKGIEAYHARRYFTVTGQHLAGTPTTVEDRYAELLDVYNEYLAPKPKPAKPAPLRLVPSGNVERCRRYIEKMPDAISGSGGHNATLHAACECFRFGLSDAEAREVMMWFNSSKCSPLWTDRELEHKLADARQKVEADGEFGARLTTPEKHTRAAPKAERAQHRSDLGNAELFVAQHGDAVRYTVGQGWLFYDGVRWERDVTGQVPQLAMKTIRKLFEDALRLGDAERKEQITHAIKSENASRIAAMQDLARYFRGVAADDDAFDKNLWRFNTLSGTVEIDPATGDYRCRKHRPEDLITKLSPVRFDESADCPTFQRFISEIFLHDQDMAAFAQRALGSCLVGEPEEILHVWFGGGDNGKSTLVDVIRQVLGDYATSLPQAFFGKRIGEAIPTDVMDLRGARLAVSHEPDQRMVLDEAKMKYLTGRDVIKARRLYRDPVEFAPTHKLVLVTNHRPAVQTQTKATWRRICLWPFLFTVPAESKDRALGEKLKAEASGILNWLLVGCSEWVSAGRHCDPPKTVRAATEDYKQAEDVLGDWLAECTENAPERTSFADLYASYEAWAKARGFEKLYSRRRLSTMLEEHSYQRRTLHGQRLFEGLRCRKG